MTAVPGDSAGRPSGAKINDPDPRTVHDAQLDHHEEQPMQRRIPRNLSHLSVFALLLASSACGSASNDEASSQSDPPNDESTSGEHQWRLVDLDDGVLRVLTTQDDDDWRVHTQGITGAFVVSDELVASAEAALPDALREVERESVVDELGTYSRRLFGAEVDGQEKLLIWLNACFEIAPEDYGAISTVADGGDCFITATYDVASASYDSVVPNGPDA